MSASVAGSPNPAVEGSTLQITVEGGPSSGDVTIDVYHGFYENETKPDAPNDTFTLDTLPNGKANGTYDVPADYVPAGEEDKSLTFHVRGCPWSTGASPVLILQST